MKPANYAPVYLAMYPELAEIARSHGYALAIHGTQARDGDFVCIPWGDNPSSYEDVVKAMCGRFAIRDIGGGRMLKAHGRYAFTLSIGWGECALDLSFVPSGELKVDDPKQHARDFLSRVVDISKKELTYTEPPSDRFEFVHVLDRNLSYYVRVNGGVDPGATKLGELGWRELGFLLKGAELIGHPY